MSRSKHLVHILKNKQCFSTLCSCKFYFTNKVKRHLYNKTYYSGGIYVSDWWHSGSVPVSWFRQPLSVKCYAVPDTRKDVIVFQQTAVVSQLQKMGNGLFLHPTKTCTQACKPSKAFYSLGFIHVKVLRHYAGRMFCMKGRVLVGWKTWPFDATLLRLEIRKTAAEGERGRERASPNATWLTAECHKHVWTQKQQPDLTVSSDSKWICTLVIFCYAE